MDNSSLDNAKTLHLSLLCYRTIAPRTHLIGNLWRGNWGSKGIRFSIVRSPHSVELYHSVYVVVLPKRPPHDSCAQRSKKLPAAMRVIENKKEKKIMRLTNKASPTGLYLNVVRRVRAFTPSPTPCCGEVGLVSS